MEKAKEGRYDGLLGAFYNEERSRFFHYTDPVSKAEAVFIIRKGESIPYSKPADLKPYRIGLLRGDGNIEQLKRIGLNFEEVNSYDLIVKKLFKGRNDVILFSKANFLELIKTDFPEKKDKFTILKPSLTVNKIFCTITKKRVDGSKIVDKFNKALKIMHSDGTYDRILEEFGQK